MNIELQNITTGYLPKVSGIYLVETISSGIMKQKRFLEARVNLYLNEKKEWDYSIDVSRQIPISISTNPIR